MLITFLFISSCANGGRITWGIYIDISNYAVFSVTINSHSIFKHAVVVKVKGVKSRLCEDFLLSIEKIVK